jgi:hypothetical protein
MIMDLNGNLVKEIANNTISKQINIEQLNNGLYILKVMLKDGSSAMDKFSINK